MHVVLTLTCLLLSFVALGCDSGIGDSANSSRRTIAVIPKGTSQEFWKSVHAGAIKAAQEVNVDLIWQGPVKQDDREQQVGVMESMTVRGVDGIVIAPVDNVALAAPTEDATRRGIPVVIIDSGLESDAYVSFVATDNYKGGVVAADHLAKLLGKSGKVVMLRNQVGSASTMHREAGFLDAMKKYPKIEVVSSDQRAGSTTELAQQKAEQVLATFKDTGSNTLTVDGIFTPCEPVSFGMMLAMEDNNVAGKVKHVGFDASPQLVDGLNRKNIDALVVQNPFMMGYLGIKSIVEQLDGKPVKKRIDTGVHLITPDNMGDPTNKKLLDPDLDRWLKHQ